MWGLIIVLGIASMIIGPMMGCALVGVNVAGFTLGVAASMLMIMGLCYLYELYRKRDKHGKTV